MLGVGLQKLHDLQHPIYETATLKMIIPLRHGDSFVLSSNVFLLMCLLNNVGHDYIPCKVITTVFMVVIITLAHEHMLLFGIEYSIQLH